MGVFAPRTATGVCTTQNTKNEPSSRFQLNAIPLTPTVFSGWNLYFPRPFQVLGLCKSPVANLPSLPAIPAWNMVLPELEIPATQATYSNITPLMMLELCIANMRLPADPDAFPPEMFAVNYIGGGIQGIDKRGYFTKYLNDSITATSRQQWLNTFMMPAALWKQFADANAATTFVNFMDKFTQFVEFIQRSADQRLYGQPGNYSIIDASGVTAWVPDTQFFFINEEVPNTSSLAFADSLIPYAGFVDSIDVCVWATIGNGSDTTIVFGSPDVPVTTYIPATNSQLTETEQAIIQAMMVVTGEAPEVTGDPFHGATGGMYKVTSMPYGNTYVTRPVVGVTAATDFAYGLAAIPDRGTDPSNQLIWNFKFIATSSSSTQTSPLYNAVSAYATATGQPPVLMVLELDPA